MRQRRERGDLYFTVGLPASGKSTHCDCWLAARDYLTHEDGGPLRPRVVVGGDDFRTALHGMEYVPRAEGSVLAAMDVAIRALLDRGHDVIVDETSTSEATVRRYLSIDIDATPVLIDVPPEVCHARAETDGKPYLHAAIDRMALQLGKLREGWPAQIEQLRAEVRGRQNDDVTV